MTCQIPAYLWFLARDREGGFVTRPYRDRRDQVLFIDARKMGCMVDRTSRELTDENIAHIANTYHARRGEKDAGEYQDVLGLCKSATIEGSASTATSSPSGRYAGAAVKNDGDEPFEQKIARLVAQLREQQAEAGKLDEAIAKNLKEPGFLWNQR